MTGLKRQLDKAAYHIDEVPEEIEGDARWAYAGAHMAVLLRWAWDVAEWGPAIHANDWKAEAHAVTHKQMTASAFLEQLTDWRLYLELFGNSLAPFIRNYYTGSGLYLHDIGRDAETRDYSWRETEENRAPIARVVNRRFKAYCETGPGGVRRPGPLTRVFGGGADMTVGWRKRA